MSEKWCIKLSEKDKARLHEYRNVKSSIILYMVNIIYTIKVKMYWYNIDMILNPGSKVRATDFGLGKPLTHGEKSERQNLGCKIGATNFGLGKPLTHGVQNPGNEFWTRKTTHPRGQNPGSKVRATGFGLGKPLTKLGATSGVQNPGDKIWATGFGLGKPLTKLGATSGGQNPGDKIRATHFGLGKPLTHREQNPRGKIRTTVLELGNQIREARSRRQNPDNGFGTRKSKLPS